MVNIRVLIERLKSTPKAPDSGVLANDLLEACYGGRHLGELLELCLSKDPSVAATGAWIISELGSSARPLLESLVPLLSHPNANVRFSMIGTVLTCATGESDAKALSEALRLLEDPERSVRWKATDFLFRATTKQLKAAQAHMETADSGSVYVAALKWLSGTWPPPDSEVLQWLQGDSTVSRKFAVAAASRLAGPSPGLLRAAASSEDPDVRQYAESRLGILQQEKEAKLMLGRMRGRNE
jgi:HEAT repeat protein